MTLGQTGQIHITLAAARAHAEWARIGLEEARRELLDILRDARRLDADGPTGLERWRHRSSATRMDIEAHVSREGDMAIVVSVRTRSRRATAERQHRRRRNDGPYRDDD